MCVVPPHGVTDINECWDNICGPNANCNNTIGNYTCTCRSGYAKQDAASPTCIGETFVCVNVVVFFSVNCNCFSTISSIMSLAPLCFNPSPSYQTLTNVGMVQSQMKVFVALTALVEIPTGASGASVPPASLTMATKGLHVRVMHLHHFVQSSSMNGLSIAASSILSYSSINSNSYCCLKKCPTVGGAGTRLK